MNGPYWNDKTGVTGEPNFRTEKPNFVTLADSEVNNGEPRTYTGADADMIRAELPLTLV